MDVDDLLDSLRQDYLSQFKQQLNEVSAEHDVVAIEPVVFSDSGDYETRGELDLPLRNDWMLMDADDMRACHFQLATPGQQFTPQQLTWNNNLQVEIFPFRWDDCPCVLHQGSDDSDINYLRQWYLKWFDDGLMDQDGFVGCVHALKDWKTMDDVIQFRLDLGSAPIEALEELFDCVELMGYQSLSLGDSPRH